MSKFIDLTGQRFGNLTVIGYIPGNRKDKLRALRICLCDCGRQVLKTDKYLTRESRRDRKYCGECRHDTKVCSICKIDKPKTEYYKLNTKKCGVQTKCKECTTLFTKANYKKNRDFYLAKNKENRNKPDGKAKRERYYMENIEKYKENYKKLMADEKRRLHRKKQSKESRIKNKAKASAQKKEYYQREEVKIRRREKHHNQSKTDIQYIIKRRLRFRLRHIIKALGNNKYKYKSAVTLLGCDMHFFKKYIEDKFTEGMSWERIAYIDIDHIKPCSKFDLTKLEEQEKCFGYKNLQPLWSIDNNIKGCKYEEQLVEQIV